MKDLKKRKQWLEMAVKYHGHLCMGQVFGVLISEMGMDLIGTHDPHEMIVVAENDRCISDAIQTITGTRLGRRSFKLRDYGKMAATFYNMNTKKAFRVWVTGKNMTGKDFFQLSKPQREKLMKEVLNSDIDEILDHMPVEVSFSKYELPGKPKIKVPCAKCKERVMDGKHIIVNGKNLCRPCAQGGYYKKVLK